MNGVLDMVSFRGTGFPTSHDYRASTVIKRITVFGDGSHAFIIFAFLPMIQAPSLPIRQAYSIGNETSLPRMRGNILLLENEVSFSEPQRSFYSS